MARNSELLSDYQHCSSALSNVDADQINTFSKHTRFLINGIVSVPGFFKTRLAKISTHSTTWQFKTIKLVQRPIKSLYLTPGSKLMVPGSIPTSPNLK